MVSETLPPFLTRYLSLLRESIAAQGERLTRLQADTLGFILLGMMMTQSLCWARLERLSGGQRRDSTLCDMFYHGIDCWEVMLRASTRCVIERFKVVCGALVLDDSDKPRSKVTSRIWGAFKAYDKATGGYFNAQNIVLLLLVSRCCTIPVGFKFYRPDPKQRAWRDADEELRAKGVAKGDRPPRPEADPAYPTKEELAVALVAEFQTHFPDIAITGVLYDEAYNSPYTMGEFERIYPKVQKITQIKSTQRILTERGKEISVEEFFKGRRMKVTRVVLRGHRNKLIRVRSVYATVVSHGKKYRIVALAYDGEKDPRYLICSDPSWRPETIVEYYSLRWLVETFFEDWKQHEGWANLAYQQGEKGSRQGVISSLLLDHSLLFHPEQSARLERQLPALTVGTLRAAICNDVTLTLIDEIVQAANPARALADLRQRMKQSQLRNESTKHLSSRHVPRLGKKPPVCAKFLERRASEPAKIAA